MTKRMSERQRWVEVFRFYEPAPENANGFARKQHETMIGIITAFTKVGRVVRAERDGSALILKARKA